MAFFRNTCEGGVNGTDVTESNSGTASGDEFSLIVDEGLSVIKFATSSALHGNRGIRITPDGTNRAYVGFSFTGALKMNTSVRFYIRWIGYPVAGGAVTFAYWANTANTNQRMSLRLNPSGILTIVNAAGTAVWSSASPMVLNTVYRVEVAAAVGPGTIVLRTYLGDNTVSISNLSVDLVGQSIGTTSGVAHFLLGFRTVVVGSGAMDIDDIAVDDTTLDLLGPTGPTEIPLNIAFVGSNTVAVSWSHPSDAPHGVTISRAPGLQTIDGNGRPVHHPQYNPMTIAGAAMIASGLSAGASPYLNNGVPLGSWTYWVARTAS